MAQTSVSVSSFVIASNEHHVVPCMRRALILSLLLLVGLGPLGYWCLKVVGLELGWKVCVIRKKKSKR